MPPILSKVHGVILRSQSIEVVASQNSTFLHNITSINIKVMQKMNNYMFTASPSCTGVRAQFF